MRRKRARRKPSVKSKARYAGLIGTSQSLRERHVQEMLFTRRADRVAVAFATGARAPPKQAPPAPRSERETLTLGGGCFWCLEAIFSELKGVEASTRASPAVMWRIRTTKQVSDGGTGHAEVVQITFDPAVISRDTILKAFFTIHDPTTLNRQGADVGAQYRSIAFYRNAEQKAAIEKRHQGQRPTAMSGTARSSPRSFRSSAFYKAEDYHQQYFKLHGENPYC